MEAHAAIERGIAAARVGNQQTAYYHFFNATRANPNDEQAWLWRASAAPRPEEALNCLVAVLALNPDNPVAQHGLEQISAALAPAHHRQAPPPAGADSASAAPAPLGDTLEQRLAWQQAFQQANYDTQPVRIPELIPPPLVLVAPPLPGVAPVPPPAVPPGAVGPAPPAGGPARPAGNRAAQRLGIGLLAAIPVVLILGVALWLGLRQFPPAGGADPTPVFGTDYTPTPVPLAVLLSRTPAPPATAVVPAVLPTDMVVPTPTATLPPLPTDTPTPTDMPTPTVSATPPPSATTTPPAPSATTTPLAPSATTTPLAPSATTTPSPAATTTPSPSATAVSPTPTAPAAVTAQAGETLAALARRLHLSAVALMAFNNLTINPSLDPLAAGQTLNVPPADYRPGQVTHMVRPGDTLSGIAFYYGVTVEAVAAKNGIADQNTVYAGQALIIPNPQK